jgi:hypothetical protein
MPTVADAGLEGRSRPMAPRWVVSETRQTGMPSKRRWQTRWTSFDSGWITEAARMLSLAREWGNRDAIDARRATRERP